MKWICTFYLTFLVICFSKTSNLYAQDAATLSKKQVRNYEVSANAFYSNHRYLKALHYYQLLEKNDTTNIYYKLMVGVCMTYKVDQRYEALKDLINVKTEQPNFLKVYYFLGKAYAVNHKFDEAISSLNHFIKMNDKPNEMVSKAKHLIQQYNSAKELVKDSLTNLTIKNIGAPINSRYYEYAPIITPDESEIIFTYRGPKCIGGLVNEQGKPDSTGDYFEDIMISHKTKGSWTSPEGIKDLNTSKPDASIALSVDGQKMLLFKSNKKDNGDIYVSNLQGTHWSTPEPLKGDVNTKYWEGSATLSDNGHYMIFASDRSGGFGGRDLYSAEKDSAGNWGNIKNLGPTINTKYDEDAPFLHPSGKTLYFSSKGHNSMGGYDIFYSQRDSLNGSWGKAINVGYPLNTVYDDRYYVLSANGKTGYFSSSGIGTIGGYDIFTVTPGYFGKKPILALIVGVVKGDNKPIGAKITVTNQTTNKKVGTFHSNSATGKYTLALTPGNKYKIGIEVDGYQSQIEYLDIKSLKTYVQVNHEIDLYSKKYKSEHPNLKIAPSMNTLQNQVDQQVNNYKSGGSATKFDNATYKNLVAQKGNVQKDSISYFVDVTNVHPLPETNTKGIQVEQIRQRNIVATHLGPFKTLKQANEYRDSLMKTKSTFIPFVGVNDHGQLKTIKEYYPQYFMETANSPVTLQQVVATNNTNNTHSTSTDSVYSQNNAYDLANNSPYQIPDSILNNKAYSQPINGLSFKLQIASLSDTSNFKLGYLSKYGKITKKTYPDGRTRYYFGPFQTLKEMAEFKHNLVKEEPKLKKSLITVFVFGQRKSLGQFINSPCAEGVQKSVDFSDLIGKDLNNPKWYHELLRKGGVLCAKHLIFKVQIAAYRHPQNYKYQRLMQFGKPTITKYPDGITRFTQGSFSTLLKAEALRQKIIKAGQTDAWITPFYNGERILMQVLIKHNFYQRSIE